MKHPLNTLTLNNGEIPVKVDYLQIKKAAFILRAINHSLRYKILKLIDKNEGICVTEIYKKLKIEQSVASQQLGILRRACIVKATRDHKIVYYTPDYSRIAEIMALLTKVVK